MSVSYLHLHVAVQWCFLPGQSIFFCVWENMYQVPIIPTNRYDARLRCYATISPFIIWTVLCRQLNVTLVFSLLCEGLETPWFNSLIYVWSFLWPNDLTWTTRYGAEIRCNYRCCINSAPAAARGWNLL